MTYSLSSREMAEAIRDWIEREKNVDLAKCKVTFHFSQNNERHFSCKVDVEEESQS